MAGSINNYFSNLIPHMQCTIPTNVQDALNHIFKIFKHPFPNINMTQVTYNGIKDIVGSLKGKSSHGYDEIPQNTQINLVYKKIRKTEAYILTDILFKDF
jgi:hypothetical protein